MTLRLTIDEAPWLAHIDAMRASVAGVAGVAPVVKGNGYGIGRAALAARTVAWAEVIVMGTVHEALQHRRVADERVLVLTPAVRPVALPSWVIPTVGRAEHVEALAGHTGPVAVKLRSSMARYGTPPEGLADLLGSLDERGHEVHAALVHLPLAGATPAVERIAEIEAWLHHLPVELLVSVSHLEPAEFAALAQRHPERRLELRMGTALWHGDKSFLHLAADVIDVHPVRAGDRVGYRRTAIDADGSLVMVGAGSSHGVAPLDGGRSPFHFARTRLALVEAPHMHTSMCFVPSGEPLPSIGDWVDVQRPLIGVAADEVVFR